MMLTPLEFETLWLLHLLIVSEYISSDRGDSTSFGFYKYTGQGLYDNYLDDWNTQISFLSDLDDLDARSYNTFFRELQLRADRELDLMIS